MKYVCSTPEAVVIYSIKTNYIQAYCHLQRLGNGLVVTVKSFRLLTGIFRYVENYETHVGTYYENVLYLGVSCALVYVFYRFRL